MIAHTKILSVYGYFVMHLLSVSLKFLSTLLYQEVFLSRIRFNRLFYQLVYTSTYK